MDAFHNQLAVITGAGSGIGKAIAIALAAGGARTLLVGRNAEKLRAVAVECGPTSRCHPADLREDAAIEQFAGMIQDSYQKLDIVVHSAGTITLAPLSTADISDLDSLYRINLRAPYLLTRALLPLLRRSQGQVVFVNSNAALRPGTDNGQYAATKAALRVLTDVLREEVNRDGIRLLTALVGRTATPMQAGVHEYEGKPYHPEHLVQPENVAAMVASALSLPRTAEVTEFTIRPMAKK
jgi:NADP-dependent 3-hydroxy acid dehydrogenase YdfG